MDHRIQQVFQTIMEGNEPATAALCRELIAQGIPASRIVRQGMIPCMDQLGGMLARQEKFIPQIMMSTRAMQSGRAMRPAAPFPPDEATEATSARSPPPEESPSTRPPSGHACLPCSVP